jgi:hypothetical protein
LATVRESRCAGIEAGERFYGYLPMADEVVLNPGRIDPRGFFDGTPHRRELASATSSILIAEPTRSTKRRTKT